MKGLSVMINRREDGACFLFDSHARDNQGMPSSTGKSVLIRFKHTLDLVKYLKNFATKLDGNRIIPFEVVGIKATV